MYLFVLKSFFVLDPGKFLETGWICGLRWTRTRTERHRALRFTVYFLPESFRL